MPTLQFTYARSLAMKGAVTKIRRLIARRRTIIPIVLSVFVLAAAFNAGIQSGVATSIGFLDIDIAGLTAALSSDEHGLKEHPYQGYETVRNTLRSHGLTSNAEDYPEHFRDYDVITAALQAAAAVDVCGSPLVSQVYNDQGIIEFMHGAFWMFGVDVKSLYYFYFTLLAWSVAVYLIIFWRSYAACALLFACLVPVFVSMFGFLHDKQLISVSNTRFLSTLGIIPLLHIFLTFFTVRTPLIEWRSLLALVSQAALVNFAIAIRSSSLWMEIAFTLAIFFYFGRVAVQATRRRDWTVLTSFIFRRGAVAIYVAAALFVCSSARLFFLLPDCGVGLGMHTFWHDVFIGFASHPGSRAVLNVDEKINGDSISAEMAKRYVKEHQLPYQTEPSIYVSNASSNRLGADGVPFGSWKVYEQVMRAAFFEFAWAHPRYAIETFAIFKPLNIIRDLQKFFATALKDLLFVKLIVLILMIAAVGRCAPRSAFTRASAAIPSRMWKITAAVVICLAAGLLAVFLGVVPYVTTAEGAFIAVLAPFLIAGVVSAFAPHGSSDQDLAQSPSLKFQHITAILVFCLALSTLPLIVVFSSEHLIADQAFIATSGVLISAIWAVAWERSMAQRWRQKNKTCANANLQ